MAGEFETGETGDEAAPALPQGLRNYVSDVTLPVRLPIELGAKAITGAGSLAVDLARARGYLPPASPDAPDFSDVQGGSSGPVPAAPAGEPIPPPDAVVPPPAPVKAKGRTRAAAPAAVSNSGADESAGLDLSPKAVVADPIAASGVAPVVAAYLADRRARVAELQDAQAQAAHNAGIAQATNDIKAAFTHEGDAARAARLAEAQRPVSDLEARQKAGDEALAQAAKFQEFSQSAEARDPNAQENVAFRDSLKKMGIDLGPAATIGQHKDLAKFALEHDKDLHDTATRLQIERENRASAEREGAKNRANAYAIANLRTNQERNEKPLAPAVTKDAEQALDALDASENLKSAQADVGPVTGALGALGIHVGAEGRYNDAANAAAGSIAPVEYPGSRGPSGAKQVLHTLPKGYQSADRAGQQFGNMDKVLLDKAESRVAALKAAHPDHPQIALLEERLAAAKKRREGAGAPAAGQASHYRYSADRKRRVPTDAAGNPTGPVENVP